MKKNRREGKKSREEWKASVGTNNRSSGTEKERDDGEKAKRGRERTREDERKERKERNEDVDPRTHRRTNVGFVKLDGIVAIAIAVERPQTTAPPSTSCGRPSLK